MHRADQRIRKSFGIKSRGALGVVIVPNADGVLCNLCHVITPLRLRVTLFSTATKCVSNGRSDTGNEPPAPWADRLIMCQFGTPERHSGIPVCCGRLALMRALISHVTERLRSVPPFATTIAQNFYAWHHQFVSYLHPACMWASALNFY